MTTRTGSLPVTRLTRAPSTIIAPRAVASRARASSSSMGSTCSWSSSLAAPVVGKGRSRVSSQVTARPAFPAASYSARAARLPRTVLANVYAGRRCTSTPCSAQNRANQAWPSALAET